MPNQQTVRVANGHNIVVDFDTDEYRTFKQNYSGFLVADAAYAQVKADQEKKRLSSRGISIDRDGFLNQRW